MLVYLTVLTGSLTAWNHEYSVLLQCNAMSLVHSSKGSQYLQFQVKAKLLESKDEHMKILKLHYQ